MDDRPEPNLVSAEFYNECSVRRTARVLALKQQSIYEEIGQLLEHISLLVPSLDRPSQAHAESKMKVLEEALRRLGDPAFADLVLQVLQHQRS